MARKETPLPPGPYLPSHLAMKIDEIGLTIEREIRKKAFELAKENSRDTVTEKDVLIAASSVQLDPIVRKVISEE